MWHVARAWPVAVCVVCVPRVCDGFGQSALEPCHLMGRTWPCAPLSATTCTCSPYNHNLLYVHPYARTHVRPCTYTHLYTHTRTYTHAHRRFAVARAPPPPPQVTLNVGGLRFTTSLSTLRNAPSPCLFNAMFRWGGVGWSGGTGEVGCGVWYMGPGPGESELSVPVIIQQERLRPLATPRVPRACPARRLPPLLLPCCAVLLRCSHGGLPAHVRPAAGGTS